MFGSPTDSSRFKGRHAGRKCRSTSLAREGNLWLTSAHSKERFIMRQNQWLGTQSGRIIASTSLVLGLVVGVCAPPAGAADKLDGDHIATSDGDLIIHPINHATLVLGWKEMTIYVDPVGGGKRFDGLPKPGLILVSDIHGDHLNAETLEAVAGEAKIVAPAAVAEKLPEKLRQRRSSPMARRNQSQGSVSRRCRCTT
jgi:Beta-lactamase superfamily domain